MPDYTVQQLREGLDKKEFSVSEIAEQYAKRIEETNAKLNSFLTVVDKEHRTEHEEHAQKEINAGNQSALTGIPYAAKDLFSTRGIRTTAGSKILEHFVPAFSATAIEKARDGILLGKTNTDEFALGSSTENSAYGPTRNPFDLTRVAGGTSGGSAAAVAAGQVPFAFGTDTGGSIRLPAAYCNVVGFKPTYGRISRYGVVSAASSLDTVGTLTRNVADAAYLLNQFAGQDPHDGTSAQAPVEDYTAGLGKPIAGMKVGIPKEYQSLDGVHPDITAAYDRTIKQLTDLGAEIVTVSLPHTEYALPAYYIINPSEVSSNLARFDGMQYGTRADGASLEEVFLQSRENGLGAESKRRTIIGAFCLSSGYYDAYYKKAQQARTLVLKDFTDAFDAVDLLLAPVSPILPFAVGEKVKDPVAMYLADVFTIPVSLAGMPSIALPVGSSGNLPIGMQLIGNHFQEVRVLQAAHAVEQALSLPSLGLDTLC